MILSSAGKYRKGIAGFMAGLFYMQLIMPLAVSGRSPASYTPREYYNSENYSKGLTGNTRKGKKTFDFFSEKNKPVDALENKTVLQDGNTKNLLEEKVDDVDIGGPGQPEMSSFQSVNGNNMVDLFTGDFSYNIPLMDVGGYPVNIHYTGGVTMDQEASWVGLGFNINPGAITRNMRGLPDDFNGTDSITKTQNIKKNKTTGVKLGGQAEMVGLPLTIGAGFGVFHNNYYGWGIEQSLNAAVSLGKKNKGELNGSDSSTGGSVSLGLGVGNNSQTGLSVSPSLNVSLKKYEKGQNVSETNFGINTNYHSRGGLSSLTINATNQKYNHSKFKPNPKWGMDANISFAQPSVTPSISMPTTSENYIFHVKAGGEAFGFHGNVYVEGYVNKQEIKEEDRIQKLPAYGYLHYTEADNNPKALLDFNREKELQFSYKSTPNIAIPQYTYDVYSISGEGTGGTIRPYRGDAGYIKDHDMRTKSSNDQFSGELGFGNAFHGGFSYDYVRSYTENGTWGLQNNMSGKLKFQKDDSLYQSVYFRNPGEKTSNTAAYYQQVGDDALIRVKLNRGQLRNVSATNSFVKYKNGRVTGELSVNNTIQKKDRDKRSQVVTYMNAQEATLYGLEKKIYSYKENTIPIGVCQDTVETIERIDNSIRKKSHLSEIDVLNADGRRYVYGIPAYNIEQKDVTFSVDKENNVANIDSGLVKYTAGSENSTGNSKGKESYFNEEKIPAYAHSFLLTGILSPDYVDIKEDGITEDDLGDAVKFNYTRLYGTQNSFEWRTPATYEKANYNEGFKTYSRDDKGTYLYGKKEVWYAHSIESKTMIALFKLSAARTDAYSAAGENGGINKNNALRKLDRIELYAKADLIKNGKKARPVKSVHFEYNNELCRGHSENAEEGKLTLKKVWFSYNGNNKGKRNPYTFNYNTGNPNYHPKKYDRWGNFKNKTWNPGGLNNADFPYVLQDSTLAAEYAGAWNLSDIKLPSGGRMKITYESDDYAFVQNKRATLMFTIAGFSKSPGTYPTNQLYGGGENEYVFINIGNYMSDVVAMFKKYVEGNEWIYMKMAVNMPGDRWGSGYEFVPVYGKIAEYGIAFGNLVWIKFEQVQGATPMVRSAFQFLKNNLSSKAYPASELGDDIDLGDAVKMLLSSLNEIRNSVSGFENASMGKGWCKTIDVSKSFIRLNSPDYKKLGGGLRVKRVEIFDNWNAMTNQRQSVYGQEYNYRTSIEVNGQKQTISSGVATYEPMIGGEENPFRQPINYSEKIAPLAPVTFLYSEMPLGESYYPGASVGYSKVRVRTINAKTKSANGWQETEFYTSKDFPTIVEHTLLDHDAKARYKPKLLNFFKIYSVDRTTVSQGFKIELNDMNGKVKSNASYAETDSLHPISYSLNFYKVDDDKAAVQKLNNNVWVVDSLNGKISKNGIIGKDIELITDFRQQLSTSTSGGLSPNLDYFQIGPFPVPIPSFFKFPQYDESLFRSAATVKVVQCYAILDSMVAMDKGSVVSTKNMLYDSETGEVLLSRTNNEFNDPVYNFSYPAHWAYSGMGMAYKNVDAVFKGLKLVNGKLFYPGTTNTFPAEKYFESGDEIWVMGETRKLLSGNGCPEFDPIVTGAKPINDKMWALDALKGREKNRGLYFIDRDGKPITGQVTAMKVLRSGKRNILDAGAGSIVSMKNPIKEVSAGNFRLVIDDDTRVVNASVATYNDLWKVDNSLYEKDTCYTKIDTATMTEVAPVSSVLMRNYIRRGDNQTIYPSPNIINSINFTSSLRNHNTSGRGTRTYRTKSIIKFNLLQIPTDATIINAKLDLIARSPKEVWNGNNDNGNENWSDRIFAHYVEGAGNGDRDARQRTNASYLSRATIPVNAFTSWNNVLPTLDRIVIGSTPNESCDNRLNIDVRTLVQNMVAAPQNDFGFLLSMRDDQSNSNTSIRTLSFCTGINPSEGPKVPNGCVSCALPRLSITYSFRKEICLKVCRNNINDTVINPYRWGILGNWRMDRAFTYYHDRIESDASNPETDIRKEGILKSFTPYWKFTDSVLLANADTTKWVWNSAMSGYNRKGFETENYDPLGRYNAGLYGYNQTLPVAVSQNSRYREMLFDGFEDYGYKTKNCTTCDSPREFDFLKNQAGASLTEIESHTGKYSIKVNAGAASKLTVPVINSSLDSLAALSIKVDSTPVYMINVVGRGKGLTGTYQSNSFINNRCNRQPFSLTRIDSTIDFFWGSSFPLPGMCFRLVPANQYNITWVGSVQARYTGFHKFYLEYAGIASATIAIGTQTVPLSPAIPVFLNAGQLYRINVQYYKTSGTPGSIRLSWSEDQNLPRQIIPQNFLYPSNTVPADTIGSVIRNIQHYCIKFNNPKPRHIIRPVFSPYQGSKMVVSAWVKMEGADCNTAPALKDVVVVSFNASGNATTVSLTKTGVRIEGWQRYESVVNIPANATELFISLNGAQGKNVFIDDVRMQPFNSSMKSYVYDPESLRLMADLDENNYAAFYEYDNDGTLIRVKKETEKGIVTIKETRSALIKDYE